MKYDLKIGSTEYTVQVGELIAGQVRVAVNGRSFDVTVADFAAAEALTTPMPTLRSTAAAVPTPAAPAVRPATAVATGGAMIAPIPGLITDVRVKVGETVQAGQCVAVMEAMKMENQLTAPVSGHVREILVQKGSEVTTGQVIMRIG